MLLIIQKGQTPNLKKNKNIFLYHFVPGGYIGQLLFDLMMMDFLVKEPGENPPGSFD